MSEKFNWIACICSAWEFKCQKFNFVGNCFFPLLLLSIKVFDIITKSWNKRTVSIQFKGIRFRAHLNHWHLFVRASKLECRNNLLLSRQNSKSIKNGGGGYHPLYSSSRVPPPHPPPFWHSLFLHFGTLISKLWTSSFCPGFEYSFWTGKTSLCLEIK